MLSFNPIKQFYCCILFQFSSVDMLHIFQLGDFQWDTPSTLMWVAFILYDYI